MNIRREEKGRGCIYLWRFWVYNSAGIDDLFEVQCELDDVTSRWKELGLALRLRPAVLKTIGTRETDPSSRLIEVLTEWLQQNYNTDCFGPPSWKLLVDAVAHRRGGSNPALARQTAANHNGEYVHMDLVYQARPSLPMYA